MGLLYKLKFANGKSYIGQTVKTLRARINQHRQAVKGASVLPVHCAWRIHGEPAVEVLGEYADGEALHAAEIAAIKACGTLSPGGYNISTGGDTAPSKVPEVAAKIAAKAKGRKASAATLATLSAVAKENWADAGYRAKVEAGVQASVTDEYRQKLSKAQKAAWAERKAAGWSTPEATREKLRARTFSEETRRRMSEAAKKRKRQPVSAETRARMSSAAAASWATSNSKDRGAAISAALQAKRAELSEAARKRWANPEYRNAVMTARAARKE